MNKDFLYFSVILVSIFVVFIIGTVAAGLILRGKYGEFYKLPQFKDFIAEFEGEFDANLDSSVETPKTKKNVNFEYDYNVETKNTITTPNTYEITITSPNSEIYIDYGIQKPDVVYEDEDENKNSFVEEEHCYDLKINEDDISFDECLSYEEYTKLSRAHLSYRSAKNVLSLYQKNYDKYCNEDPDSSSCEFWDERTDQKMIEFTNEKNKLKSLLSNYDE